MQTHYDFLGLAPSAEEGLIRQTIEETRTALQHHAPGSATARYKLKLLDTIAQVLLDPVKRQSYDTRLAEQTPPAPPLPNLSGAARPLPSNLQCANCGSALVAGAPFCGACGAGTPVPTPSSAQPGPEQEAPELDEVMLRIARFLGWRCQRGTVFLAEPPYHADSEFILSRFLLKIAVLGMLGYGCYYLILNHFGAVGIMALGVILLAVFASGVFAILLSQILSLVVSSTRGGGNKPVAVRDLRLRDDEGDEHSIRCRGELRSGSISVGDDVLVWGMDRGGMLMVRFGWNYRTRTRINVRYR